MDREKAIKELHDVRRYLEDKEWSDRCASQHIDAIINAIALLKGQEAVEPTINEYGEAFCVCGENVGIIPSSKNLPSIRSKYCSECGRRMMWNE